MRILKAEVISEFYPKKQTTTIPIEDNPRVDYFINKIRYLKITQNFNIENVSDISQNSALEINKLRKLTDPAQNLGIIDEIVQRTPLRSMSLSNLENIRNSRSNLNSQNFNKVSQGIENTPKYDEFSFGSFNKEDLFISAEEEARLILNAIPEGDKPNIKVFPAWSIVYLKFLHKMI